MKQSSTEFDLYEYFISEEFEDTGKQFPYLEVTKVPIEKLRESVVKIDALMNQQFTEFESRLTNGPVDFEMVMDGRCRVKKKYEWFFAGFHMLVMVFPGKLDMGVFGMTFGLFVAFITRAEQSRVLYDSMKSLVCGVSCSDQEKQMLGMWMKKAEAIGAHLSSADQELHGKLGKQEAELQSAFEANRKVQFSFWINAQTEERGGLSGAEMKQRGVDPTHGLEITQDNINALNGLEDVKLEKMVDDLKDSRGSAKLFVQRFEEIKAYVGDTKSSLPANIPSNEKVILRLLQVRHEIATLHGYANYAEFVMKHRATTVPKVQEFLNRLDKLMDVEAVEDEQYEVGFALEDVVAAVFSIAERAFGLKVEEEANVPQDMGDMKYYKITNLTTEKVIGFFYVNIKLPEGGVCLQASYSLRDTAPVVMVLNAATKDRLTFPDVTTIWHEFGHVLQGTNASHPHIDAMVAMDPVLDSLGLEIPPSVMECWLCNDLVVQQYLMANRDVPDDVWKRDLARWRKQKAYELRQRKLDGALIDMALHSRNEAFATVEEMEAALPNIKGKDLAYCCSSEYIKHIFGHLSFMYAGSFYYYIWAFAEAADYFDAFSELGFEDDKALLELGCRYRLHVLERPTNANSNEVFEAFRERTRKDEYFLKTICGK